MIPRSLTGTALAALFALTAPLAAAPSAWSGYGTELFHTHTNADHVVSFDWSGSGEVIYQTANPLSRFGGLFSFDGISTANPVAGSSSLFAGASVVTIGDAAYFNYSTTTFAFPILKYGPLSGTPTASVVSSASNYALHGYDGDLFITGFGQASNEIFHSDLTPSGELVPPGPVSIGVTPGYSGPLAFDSDGNLFYAQGYAGHEIYRWSADEVADAIADPVQDPLSTAGHLWLDYSSLYASPFGATSMLVGPDGDLLVTLTHFENPSVLVSFDIAPNGTYGGTTGTLLSDTGLLGELRTHDGNLYISSDNAIYQIVPEPGTAALLALALPGFALRRRRS